MSLFQIPDIRLFWLTDKRFLSQFECIHICGMNDDRCEGWCERRCEASCFPTT